MDLWAGTGIFRYEGFEEELPIRVFLDVDFDLKIETNDIWNLELLVVMQRDDLTVEIRGVQEPIRLLMSHTSKTDSQQRVVFTPRQSPIWRATRVPLFRGRASLINFGGFKKILNGWYRLNLEACGWSMVVVPVNEDSLCYPERLRSDEHTITHQLEFSRTDCAAFSSEQMIDFLFKVAEFFSFCHGGWVAIGLAVGFDRQGEVAADEWGTGRIGPGDSLSGCFDCFQIRVLEEFYPLFMQRVQDEAWADTVAHVNYWLRRSQLENAGPDGGIILLQAALERFAWHLLVRDQEAISEKGFSELTAADQLRLMLNALHLPKQVPPGLEALLSFAKANGLDAAEAITRVRNRIVHPPKRNAKDENLPYYDVYRLGRWYAELAVLASCGYQGKYSNRTRKDQWVGQVEDVPWASG